MQLDTSANWTTSGSNYSSTFSTDVVVKWRCESIYSCRCFCPWHCLRLLRRLCLFLCCVWLYHIYMNLYKYIYIICVYKRARECLWVYTCNSHLSYTNTNRNTHLSYTTTNHRSLNYCHCLYLFACLYACACVCVCVCVFVCLCVCVCVCVKQINWTFIHTTDLVKVVIVYVHVMYKYIHIYVLYIYMYIRIYIYIYMRVYACMCTQNAHQFYTRTLHRPLQFYRRHLPNRKKLPPFRACNTSTKSPTNCVASPWQAPHHTRRSPHYSTLQLGV